MPQLAIRLSSDELAALDRAVVSGGFDSRAEAVRSALVLLSSRLRERAIAERYRSAYGDQPLTDEERLALDAATALAVEI
jgi:Arc/MetJ-type ribon-helix-helix transcriptional regulator